MHNTSIRVSLERPGAPSLAFVAEGATSAAPAIRCYLDGRHVPCQSVAPDPADHLLLVRELAHMAAVTCDAIGPDGCRWECQPEPAAPGASARAAWDGVPTPRPAGDAVLTLIDRRGPAPEPVMLTIHNATPED